MKNLWKSLALAGACLFVLGACNNDNEQSKEGNEPSTVENKGSVMATVNDKEIFESDYNLLLEETKASYAQQGVDYESLDETMKEKLSTQVLDQLINTELLVQAAENEGVQVEETAVDTQLEEMKAQFEDEAKFQEALEKNNLTEEELKDRVKMEMLITQYLDANVGEVNVTDEEVNAAYEQYKAAMEAQEQEVQDLADIKDALLQQAVSQKRQQKISDIIEQLRNENDIKIL